MPALEQLMEDLSRDAPNGKRRKLGSMSQTPVNSPDVVQGDWFRKGMGFRKGQCHDLPFGIASAICTTARRSNVPRL